MELADLDGAVGVTGQEGVDDASQLVAQRPHDAQPQRASNARRGGGRLSEALLDQGVGLLEILAQPSSDGGQCHSAAGALEQGCADAAFLVTSTGPGSSTR